MKTRWAPTPSGPSTERNHERGAVLVFVSFTLVVLFGIAALAVDLGQLFWTRRQLQNAADAATLAAVEFLPATSTARSEAVQYANLNRSGSLDPSDVDFGFWDQGARSFDSDGNPINAVRVTTRETVDNKFARVLGFDQSDVTATSTAMIASSSVDFEGSLEPGDQPNTLSWGSGISGQYIPGYVTITGSGHGPMIFDGTCDGGPPSNCTGGDSDLYHPGQNNILILSEDGDSNDPDDDAGGGWIEIDFSNFGEGSVTVASLVFIDSEEDGHVYLYSGGELVDEAVLGAVADGTLEYRFVSDVPGVDFIRIELGGSGAIDDIGYETVSFLVE